MKGRVEREEMDGGREGVWGLGLGLFVFFCTFLFCSWGCNVCGFVRAVMFEGLGVWLYDITWYDMVRYDTIGGMNCI